MSATDVDLAAVMRFIRRRTRNAITIDGLTRTEHPEYPLPAVREALVNAVAHADYSQLGAPIRVSIFADRLEIESRGVMPYSIGSWSSNRTSDEARSELNAAPPLPPPGGSKSGD